VGSHVPVNPENLSAKLDQQFYIDLSWIDLSDNERIFLLERWESRTGKFEYLKSITADHVTYKDTSAYFSSELRYRIRAEGISNVSDWSNIATVFTSYDSASSDTHLPPQLSKDITIYPNPASDLLSIIYSPSNYNNRDLKINLYDLNGRIVMHKSIENGSQAVDTKINLSSLFPGAYIIEMQDGYEKIRQKVIVK
jgi:hypothetical protein